MRERKGEKKAIDGYENMLCMNTIIKFLIQVKDLLKTNLHTSLCFQIRTQQSSLQVATILCGMAVFGAQATSRTQSTYVRSSDNHTHISLYVSDSFFIFSLLGSVNSKL